MFARILVISDFDDIKSAWLAEALSVLQDRRHAVCVLNPASWPKGSLLAALDAFSPTVTLWDIDSTTLEPGDIQILSSDRHCVACVTGGSRFDLDMPFPVIRWPFDFFHVDGLFDDEVFGESVGISTQGPDGGAAAPVLGIFQGLSNERLSSVLSALDTVEGLSCISFDESWGSFYKNVHPYANPRYWQRRSSLAVYFAGGDAPSAAQVLHQISCGSVVFIENGASVDLPSIDNVCIRFTPEGLGDILASFIGDADLLEKAADAQREALQMMPSSFKSILYSLTAIDHVRIQREDTLIMSQDEPCRTFTLFGWFGARNFGDDLLLRFAVHSLSHRYPNAQFRVIGADSAVLHSEFGFMACTPDQKDVVRTFLEQSDALVLFGGLLFDDPLSRTAGSMEFCLDPWIEPTGQAAVCLLARTLGVPSIYLGAGAGPLDNVETRRAVQLIGLSGARFFLRDQHSCDLLLDCCVDEDQIGLYADLVLGSRSYVEASAHTVAAEESLRPGVPYFIVSLRDWHLNPADFAQKIARAIDLVARRTGLMPLFLPFDVADVAIHRAVCDAMESDCLEFLDSRPDEAHLFDLIEGSSFCLAMRLHCSILHHVLGKPAVGLDYNDKIRAHFESMGQLDLLAGLELGAEELAEMMAYANGDLPQISEAVLDRVEELSDLVRAAFDDLGGAIAVARGNGRYAPRGGSAIEYPRLAPQRVVDLTTALLDSKRRIEELEARLADAEHEAEASRDRVDELTCSSEFKLGSSLMRVPNAIRSLLNRLNNR